ncbi:MAG: acetyl ornithine aminotransferase family protein [Nitrososphaerota archaeon]|nr:acetyl ornithine aminotransferase family protein [Nitrososphaerota archaeon]
MRHIDIKTAPPGPKARKVVEETQATLSPSIDRFYPLVVESAHGSLVKDVDGNTYVDLNSGLGVLGVGSTPERVVKAVARQSGRFMHYSYTDFYYGNIARLARKLSAITPGRFEKRVYFGNSGTEAVEAAIKLSRYRSGRQRILAFTGAFHGRTMGAVSLTASKPRQMKGFSPLLPGVTHVPYPYCYRCPFGQTYPECGYFCVDYISDQVLDKYVPADEVSSIFFEPIQGEGGYVVPPPDYFRRLQKLAKGHGIMLVDDEIQSGMGRTGRWFAIEHFGVVPDMVLVAKALASGLPLSALVAGKETMSWGPGSHASTFGANPVAAEAALATIGTIEDEGLLARARRTGGRLMKRLLEMKEKYEIVGDVRGKGLMVGMEIVKDKKGKESGVKEMLGIVDYSWRHGALVISCGKSTIRFFPPLNIPQDALDEAIDVVEEGVRLQSR